MANNIDFNVSTNAVTVLNQTAGAADGAAKGFTSAKAELRALNNQLLTMDQSSDAFKKASTRAAELKDNISDLGAEINANAGNAFEGLSNNVGLFGSRLMSLDLKGAGQALSGMGAAVGKIDFKTLKDEVGGLIKGFGNLTKAILANPYLLLAGAIIAIIANFDKLIKLFPSVEKGLTGINEQERESLALSKAKADASQKAYENIDKQTNILKLQGKSEKEILQIKIKALETAIADRKAQLAITEKQAITQVQTAKRNREILEGVIRFLTAPLQILLSAVDGIAAMLGQESKLAEGFTDLAAGLLIDPDELQAELDKTIQENKDAVATMENDYAGLKLSVQNIDKAAAKTSNDNLKKQNEDLAKANEDAKKLYKDKRDAEIALEDEKYKALQALQETAQEKEVTAAVEASEALYTLAGEDEAAQILIAENLAKKLADINKKYADEAAAKKKEENEKKKADDDKAAKEELDRLTKFNEEKLKAEEALVEAKFSLASASVNLLGTLFAKNKKAADIAFALDKALAIAGIVVNTAREISGISGNPTLTALPDTGLTVKTPLILAAKIRAAASIAGIVGTTIGKFMSGGSAGAPTGGGGGGGGGGGTTAPSPANFDFLQNQQQQQPPLQAYVVSGQVSSNLEAQQLINNQARLGG